MAFPATQLRCMVEVALGADLTASPLTYTTWTDVTAYALALDAGGALTSRHGRADEFTTAPPSQGTVTMNSSDGRWVERYPLGAWYGLIGPNTPLRWLNSPDVNAAADGFGRTTASGWGTADSGQAWTVVGTAGDYATTSGAARVTHGTAAVRHYGVLPMSMLTFDVTVRIRTGALATGAALSAGVVWHYADANNSNRFDVVFGTDQTVSVRAAIRSGGSDAFGASHTVAGLTHAANTFFWLRVQSHSADARRVRAKVWLDGTSQPTTWAGYSTINGNLTAGSTGLTSTRETGNTNASATVDFDDMALTDGWYPRHTGYIDALPRRWPDHSATVLYVPITASGMTRRLQQGGVIRSAIKAAALAQSPGPRAYWAMEDGSSSTQVASSLPGGLPMTITGAESLGSARAAGSDPVVTVSNTGLLRGPVGPYSGTDWTVMWLINIPAAVASEQALLRWQTSGSWPTWQLVLTPQVGDDLLTLRAYDQNFVEVLGDTGMGFADSFYGQQLWIEVSAQQVGADISWSYEVWLNDIGFGRTGTKVGSTAGTVTAVAFGNGAGANLLQGMTLGHISVWDNATISLGVFASEGFGAEKSTTRLARLGGQEHVTVQVPATPVYDYAVMGPPTSSTLLAQLREIETTEQGILFDDLDGAITLVPRESRVNQPVALTLDVALGHLGPKFEPDNDDQQLVNDATSSQPNGSSYRHVDTGPRGVTARGYYSKPFSPNVAYAADLRQDAEFRTALGTVDDDRFTSVPLDLTRNPSLIPAWLACTVGSRIQIINTSVLFTPDPIDLIIEGWEERQSNVDWKVTLYTSSAKPWNAWILETGTGNKSRFDSGTSLLAAAATSGATALVVTTSDQLELWTTLAADFPFDVGVGGERLTVGSSGVAGIAPTLLDTFTRTVANGWGTPDNGPSWTVAGTASDYSVNGSVGVHNLSTTVTQRESMAAVGLGPAVAVGVNPALTVEVLADWIRVPTAPTGGTVTVSLIACRSDANNYVALQLFFQAGGTVTVAVEQVVAGVATAQDTTFPSVGAAASTYSARLVVSPTTIQGRVWVRGTTEQTSTWTTSTATTTTPPVGSIVWRTERAAGNTNVAPYNIELDGLQLPKTQTFTVTRAVNGVTKAQQPGWRVGLWNPSVLAL